MTFACRAQRRLANLILVLAEYQRMRPEAPTRPQPHPNLHPNGLARLELVIQTGGNADEVASTPGRRSRAAVIREHGIRAVVAIRRHAPAASAQIVVSIAVIDGIRRIEV